MTDARAESSPAPPHESSSAPPDPAPATPSPPPGLPGGRKRPSGLAPGARVGVVAPSGPVRDRARAEAGLRTLGAEDYVLEVDPGCWEVHGYLAGPDEARAESLLRALERPDLDAIVCLRGGYGAGRTAAALDLDRLRALRGAPPKVFLGFSDVTVLHAVLAAELSWVTYYGPVVTTLAEPTPYTMASLRAVLAGRDGLEVRQAPDRPATRALAGGKAEGVLSGGCLALLDWLVATPWEPSFAGAILCLEDVGCEPYEIDRYVSHLVVSGRLAGVAGVVVGEHAGCEPAGEEPSQTLEEIYTELLAPLGVPVLFDLPIGHGAHQATLPLGVAAELDADAGVLRLLEPATEPVTSG